MFIFVSSHNLTNLTDIYSVVLPYADLVLFTASASLAVVFGVFLAIIMLGEKFVCRYDFSAMVLIVGGALLTVYQSNFSEYKYTAYDVKQLLIGYKALGFLIFTLIISFASWFSYGK